jgi:hypothetical protein
MPVSTIQNASLASGVPSAAKLPAGSVLQVVNYTSQISASTQSASFVTTGHAVSITPTSSSSKILIITNATGYVNGGGIAGAYTIYRNSTNLSSGTSPSQLAGIYNGATSGNLVVPISMTYLDSPATTSSTTYTVYFGVLSNTANTLYYGFNSGITNSSGVVITAMEIAA